MGKRIKLIDLFYYLAWCFLLVGEFYICLLYTSDAADD